MEPVRLDATAPCLCGSENPLKECCLFQGRLFLKETRIDVPLGSYAHPKCYAAALRGCSSTLSLEHYLSHSALRLMAGPDGMLRIEGMSLPPAIPAARFGSRILCTAHNNALSPLDAVGVRLFAAFHSIDDELKSENAAPYRVLVGVNGYDFERWLLKLLIGYAVGVIPETKDSWQPPLHWLRVLFGKRQMPKHAGLSSHCMPDSIHLRDQGIGIAPMYNIKTEPRTLAGVRAVLTGIDFSLMMDSVASRVGTYRVGGFRYRSLKTSTTRVILLSWPGFQRAWPIVDIEWSDRPFVPADSTTASV